MIIYNNCGGVDYYYCEPCNYRTRILSCYNKHLITFKHGNLSNNINENNNEKYKCLCGKVYKHRQTLHKHKKTCNYIPNENNNYEIDYKELYLKALENNKEKICFKKLYLKLNIDLDDDI